MTDNMRNWIMVACMGGILATTIYFQKKVEEVYKKELETYLG